MVTLIQRFGSALNLNVHLHLLVLDGVYTFERERPCFHRTPEPSQAVLERLLDALIRRITRTLVRAGALIEEADETTTGSAEILQERTLGEPVSYRCVRPLPVLRNFA